VGTQIEINNFNPYTITGGLYAQTGNSTPIVGTTPGDLLDGGVGTLSVPANFFKVGDSFKLDIGGVVSCANNQPLYLAVTSNGTIPLALVIVTLDTTTNKNFTLNIWFTIRQIGAATVANIQSFGKFTYSKDAASTFEGLDFSSENTTTFDTTINNTLSVKAEWSINNPSNSIYTTMGVLTKIY